MGAIGAMPASTPNKCVYARLIPAGQGLNELLSRAQGPLVASQVCCLSCGPVCACINIRASSEAMELKDLADSYGKISALIMGVGLFVFSSHWAGNAYAQDIATPSEQNRLDDGRVDWLEIRGAGVGVSEWHQTDLWKKIKKQNDNTQSIFSRRPEDYPSTLEYRHSVSQYAVRATFQHSAKYAVAYWPVPTFASAPPKRPEMTGASAMILTGRNEATLGVTLFVAERQSNTTHGQEMIEALYRFMEANPTVPEVLIASQDGDEVRDGQRPLGSPGLPKFGSQVSDVFESVGGLLLARSDRVDRYLRPFAVDERENNQNTSTDLGKLWALYWQKDRSYSQYYADHERGQQESRFSEPGTMSSAYWQSQLPELKKQLANRGPGNFQPSVWLPIRWAEHQIKEFDNAPLLGYLHAPVKVAMRDANGKALKPALQAQALQAGWLKAVQGLPSGLKPVRVFYDSSENADGEIALTTVLHGLNTDGQGLDLSHADAGYDIGRRLGKTGVSSPMVQINLATFASYLEGGVSAVVYSGADGSMSVQMLRPPSEDAKARNAKRRSADPFAYGMPK